MNPLQRKRVLQQYRAFGSGKANRCIGAAHARRHGRNPFIRDYLEQVAAKFEGVVLPSKKRERPRSWGHPPMPARSFCGQATMPVDRTCSFAAAFRGDRHV